MNLRPPHPKKKVLLLGNDDRVMLAVARSLGRRGIDVHTGWCAEDAPVCASRYVSQWQDLPSYQPRDPGWINSLIALMRKEHYDLLLPVNDPAVVPLEHHRCQLTAEGRVYSIGEKTFDITYDKFKMDRLAESLAIPMPRGVCFTLPDDVVSLTERLAPPYYIKPQSSVTLDDLLHKQCVIKARTLGELNAELDVFPSGTQLLVQEGFSGRGVGVEVLADAGTILVAFQHARIHETLDGGSTYRESVPLDPRLVEAAEQLLQALNYTGVAMLEFLHNPDTDRWVFLEINARFWGSLPLAVAAGADFPRYLYEFVVEGRRDFQFAPGQTGVRCRNLVHDLRWIRSRWQAADRAIALEEAGRDMFRLLTARDCIDTFVRDDPMPGLRDLSQWFGLVLRNHIPVQISRPANRLNE